jgi:hypothetical protein
MKSYAGIGSRDITDKERETIMNIAAELASMEYICYSGNACGSDIAFQMGSNRRCVIFLPWYKFNFEEYEPVKNENCIDYIDVGNRQQGNLSVDNFHPNPRQLSQGGFKLMARNYYQVNGLNNYPVVDFVLCCADVDKKGNVKGGTGQAVRIAKSMNIPIINIRVDGWQDTLENLIYPIF